MPFLRKIEDVLVQVIKLVLLAFALWILAGLAKHLYDKAWPTKDTAASTATAVNWNDVRPDMQFVLEETGRDLGLHVTDKQLQERLTDAQLRPAFQKADQLLRDFVAQKAEHHAQIEKDNESRGLAPLHPLLAGEALPTAPDIAVIAQAQQAATSAHANASEAHMEQLWGASDSAAAAEASDAEDACCWTEAVDVAQALHNSATQAYGDAGYAAYVLGAPAAIETVLKDATLEPKLREMTVSRLLDTVLTNYSISFSRAVSEQDSDSSNSDNLWESLFSSIELTMWSVILSFLVLVVFVVMLIRMEKHLGRMSRMDQPTTDRD